MKNYLSETLYFDFKDEKISAFIKEFRTDTLSEKQKAIGLYLKIRDGWRYNPYCVSFQDNDYKASVIIQKKDGHCIDKATLYIAGLRSLGIPARLRLAAVKNHIGVEKLEEKFGTNKMTPHGMVEVFLDEKWVKATPAFNKELCHLCNVEPLEFDGENDSIFQEYSKSGGNFMEYLEDYGHFDDVPVGFIKTNMIDNYPFLQDFLKKDLVFNL